MLVMKDRTKELIVEYFEQHPDKAVALEDRISKDFGTDYAYAKDMGGLADREDPKQIIFGALEKIDSSGEYDYTNQKQRESEVLRRLDGLVDFLDSHGTEAIEDSDLADIIERSEEEKGLDE